MRNWVITDIHGCAKTFVALLGKIGFNRKDTLYLLGDYIDRGPDSRGVLDLIMQLKQTRHHIHCLLGNHEFMMLHARQHPASQEALHWKRFNGGDTTLQSFDAVSVKEIDGRYIDFILNMDHYMEVDRYILVHAGLNLSIEDPLSDKNAMLWIRGNSTLNKEWLGDRIIVHGHTPLGKSQIQKNVEKMDQYPIVDIDSGCVYPRPEYNHLCALELNSRKIVFQQNIDD